MYRLGLSPRRWAAERLAADEWWLCYLADELGVGENRLKDWVKKGYVHARRVRRRGHLAV